MRSLEAWSALCGSHAPNSLPLLLDMAPTPDWLRYAGDHTALSKQRRGAAWVREWRTSEPDPTLVWLVHVWSTRQRNRAVRNGLLRFIVRPGRKCDPAG